ncbi:MAG: zinc ribbon domain-containing protein [Nocardioides sp.]|jgi:uncharacterized OB-fold protein
MSADTALGAEVGLRPVTTDPDTRGIFEAAREGRLVVQGCSACGQVQQPPRPVCRACLGTDLTWVDLPGRGVVHTWTVVEHQINPSFPVPYTTILVDVDPGTGQDPVRFLGHLAGRPDLHVGTPVTVEFVDLEDDITIPNWQLAAD